MVKEVVEGKIKSKVWPFYHRHRLRISRPDRIAARIVSDNQCSGYWIEALLQTGDMEVSVELSLQQARDLAAVLLDRAKE